MPEFNQVERDNYESWTVDLSSVIVFMEVYNPPQNGFAAKHLLRGGDATVKDVLDSRNLKGCASSKELGDKMLAFNLKLKATKDEPDKKTSTNTMIDLSMINIKTVAAEFAQAIVNTVGVAGADQWYDNIAVDLGTPCIISDGNIKGKFTKVTFGGTKIATANKGGKTFISFKLAHCGGGIP